ncbi:MAG: hypothetical protein ACRCX8_04985, partial [Sarcina sp.]
MLDYLDILGIKKSIEVGLEARNMQKAKTFNLTKTDFFLAPKITDPSVVITMDTNEEKVFDLFKKISTRESKMKIVRFKGYYIKPRYMEVVGAKRIMKNMRPVYSEISKNKKQLNIGTLSTRQNTFKNMSYMYNLGYLLNEIKIKTFDKGLLMSKKVRESILEVLKREILETDSNKERVLYFRGPFLTNTKIGLNIVDSMLLKVWNPTLLFLEWFYSDETEFKKWMSDNKVNIVFDNGTGNYLVLSRSEVYQKNPMYNFKYLLRLLHRMDGANLKEMGLSQEEIDEIETIVINNTAPDETISAEELKKMELVPDEEGVEVDEEDEMNDFIDSMETIEKPFSGNDELVAKNQKEIEKIFNEVPPEERGVELLELHNYTSLKKDVETEYVKTLRKKMVKNYGLDTKAIVNNLANHKIEIAKFNNKVDNDYNQSSFILLDKSYQDKLADSDMLLALTAPSNLGFPLFLTDVKKI